jgi:hypothetical protein
VVEGLLQRRQQRHLELTSSNVTAVRSRIATAYTNLRTAMRNAGYADSAWTLLVQNYPSPVGLYEEKGLLATRSCVRQAYNGGAPRGGRCTISGSGLLNGEPRMSLS